MRPADKKINGYEKAAILLFALGEEVTSTVFSRLNENEIRKIGNVMAGIKHVPLELRDAVLNEFAHIAGQVGLISGGDEFMKNVLYNSLGEEKGKELLKNIDRKPSGLSAVKNLHPKMLSQFIRNEHPQTIAMILAHLEPIRSAEVLQFFPATVKKEIIARIATLDNISPEAIEEVEEIMKKQLKSLGSQYGETLGGAPTAAEILNQMDKASEEFILEKIESEDPDLALSIRELMFVFEDINGIDDRGIQTMLKEINNEQLIIALKTASEELKEKIFRNMSERASLMMKEDMESMGPVKVSDVEGAQQEIITVVRKLEEQGKLIVGGKGGEDLVV